jgi:hypothetical protein
MTERYPMCPPPRETARRNFLTQAAAVAAGSAALTLAVVVPTLSAASPAGALRPDAMLQLIADHKAAILEEATAMRAYGALEETLPEDLRRTDMQGGIVTEVDGDDPRWIEATHRYANAFAECDDIATQMLDAPITSLATLAAIVSYAGEHLEAGYLWPDSLYDETEGASRSWERWLFLKLAGAVRGLEAGALS